MVWHVMVRHVLVRALLVELGTRRESRSPLGLTVEEIGQKRGTFTGSLASLRPGQVKAARLKV